MLWTYSNIREWIGIKTEEQLFRLSLDKENLKKTDCRPSVMERHLKEEGPIASLCEYVLKRSAFSFGFVR